MKKRLLSVLLCTAVAAAAAAGCSFGGASADRASADNAAAGDAEPGDTAAADDTEPAAEPDDTDAPDDDGSAPDHEEPSSDTDASADTVSDDPAQTGSTIAIAMPDQSSQRWVQDAENMKKALEAQGYTVEIQYADNDPAAQASQIEDFVADGAGCIVVAAVDSAELAGAADAAADAQIPVIAYDSLLMDTDAVSFYTAFDHKGTGVLMGRTIVEKAGLDSLGAGEYKTIEFFVGPAEDGSSRRLYDGLMEVLQPYLDNGTLVCNTERTSFEDACMADGSEEAARERCGNYLAGYYIDEDLDICAAALDDLAYGCKAAFLAAGYTEDNWPVISGQDCGLPACRNISDGTQAFSIFKDTRVLADRCAAMIDAVMNGMAPEINDTEQYSNNVMQVPAYLCTPVVVDKDNLQTVIVDSGYYTEEDISSAQ